MTNKKHAGFTLIEMMLAMAVVSFMLLFVVSAIMQATRLYTKGLAIRQINQTGRQVIDTLGKSMRYAKPTYLAANKRICVGGTTYAWNVENEAASVYKNKLDDGTAVRFVSVQDPTGDLCVASPMPPNIIKEKAVDLVGFDITPLSFAVEPYGSSLWEVRLILSTAGSNLAVPDLVTPGSFYCEAQNNFCAFGDFETSIYSRGS